MSYYLGVQGRLGHPYYDTAPYQQSTSIPAYFISPNLQIAQQQPLLAKHTQHKHCLTMPWLALSTTDACINEYSGNAHHLGVHIATPTLNLTKLVTPHHPVAPAGNTNTKYAMIQTIATTMICTVPVAAHLLVGC
jgi:hypothetical protein